MNISIFKNNLMGTEDNPILNTFFFLYTKAFVPITLTSLQFFLLHTPATMITIHLYCRKKTHICEKKC